MELLHGNSASDFADRHFEEFQYTCHSLRADTLLGYLGYLNRLVWVACKEYGLIEIRDGRSLLNRERLTRIRGAIAGGHLKVRVALDAAENYLKQFWGGASYTRKSLRKYRNHCQEMGLFRVGFSQFIAQKFDGVPRTPSPEISHFDFDKLFKLIGIIERALEFKGYEWQHFPGRVSDRRPMGANDRTWKVLGTQVRSSRNLARVFPSHGNALPHLLKKALEAIAEAVSAW